MAWKTLPFSGKKWVLTWAFTFVLYYVLVCPSCHLKSKLNFLILHEDVRVCILHLRDFCSGRQNLDGLK